ncbi:hypothetical protein TREVI0001_0768 [Treponema vincentii ATCC 35580]|uniref:Uncharacterized protein n=1 Tax=Treponema vincentii ATCC 35580 TaxID=596324 RepID=C8PR77_9SPIR|nr:hypothetical protein TREVI0001_0768 [Treponema vincentii ATCC 35580]
MHTLFLFFKNLRGILLYWVQLVCGKHEPYTYEIPHRKKTIGLGAV